jgi:hypothetical protein
MYGGVGRPRGVVHRTEVVLPDVSGAPASNVAS